MGVVPPIASNTAEAYLGGDFLILFRSQTFSSTLGQAVTAEIGEKSAEKSDNISNTFEKVFMNFLVLNAGSSSLKFQIIATDLARIQQYNDACILRGELHGIGCEAIVRVGYRSELSKTVTAPLRDMGAALNYLLRYLASDRSGIAEIKSTADVHA